VGIGFGLKFGAAAGADPQRRDNDEMCRILMNRVAIGFGLKFAPVFLKGGDDGAIVIKCDEK